jgi:hypothetical protein
LLLFLLAFIRQVAEKLPEIVDFDEIEILPPNYDDEDRDGGLNDFLPINEDFENVDVDSDDDKPTNRFIATAGKQNQALRRASADNQRVEDENEDIEANFQSLDNERKSSERSENSSSTNEIISKQRFSFRLKFLEKQRAWVEKAARRSILF